MYILHRYMDTHTSYNLQNKFINQRDYIAINEIINPIYYILYEYIKEYKFKI